jgi:hypothetical protein
VVEQTGRVRARMAGLLAVIAATVIGCATAGSAPDALPKPEVGSCFAIDASGRVEPASCAEDNDGTVSAEVTDVDDCSLLARGGTVAFTVVDGRTSCLTDR